MDVNSFEFEKLMNEKPGAVLDVRTPGEYHSGRIPGAINADVMAPHHFEANISKLNPSDRVYVYCRSGGRSGVACQMLRQKGFNDIVHLCTGFMSWHGEVH
jgi:rhodanese-related sulfurtransferase